MPKPGPRATYRYSEHRKTQTLARNGNLTDYRLRITQVIRNYGLMDREQAPKDYRLVYSA